MAIIAVSDVHLGYVDPDTGECSDEAKFVSFLGDMESGNLVENDKISDFVICGDFLDMWRRDMAGVAIEHFDILNKLQNLQEQQKIKVHYLAGNHDYHVYNLGKYNYQFDLLKHYPPRTGFTIPEGDKTYWFKHGYDFERLMSESECFFEILSSTSDETGELKSWLWDLLSNIAAARDAGIDKCLKILENTADEILGKHIESVFRPKWCNSSGVQEFNIPNKDKMRELKKPFAIRIQPPEAKSSFNDSLNKSLKENIPLIFGHTHMPFHYEKDKKKAINLGSWIIPKNKDRNYDTYLEIKKGQERLLDYRTKEELPKTDVLPIIT
ncbi:MAG: metallophosphoesterase [Methanotrichaceae archaeon]